MSKTNRRKSRNRRKWLEQIAPVPPRKKRGRERMAEIAADPEPQRVALSARNRQQGDPDTPETRHDKRHPAYSEPEGRAIMAEKKSNASELWATYASLTNAERIYRKYYVGQDIHPKGASLELLPESLEVRADIRPDLRTESEKAADAVTRWMAWQGRVGKLGARDQAAIWAVLRHGKSPFEGGRATLWGKLFVAALGNMLTK